MTGGARIEYDPNDPLLSGGGTPTDAQLKDILVKQKGADVRVNLIERNGIYWPVDFQSWNIAATYYNFELAYDYYNSLGILDPTEFSNSSVYYFPDFIPNASVSTTPEVDDALFYSPVQAFLILPFDQLQGVPIPMNRGALAHEFSHRIFNGRVYHGQANPTALTLWSSTTLFPAYKVLKSFDEGLADFHAVESLCTDGTPQSECEDTLFLEPTLGTEAAQARDVSVPNRCLTTSLINALNAEVTADQFVALGQDYQVGTVIASSLYIAGENTQQQSELSTAVVQAYDDTAVLTPGFQQLVDQNLSTPDATGIGGVNLVSFANAIVSHISDTNLQEQVCEQFVDRLRFASTDLPACNGNPGAGLCPPLQ
jgi:hypothetical protein